MKCKYDNRTKDLGLCFMCAENPEIVIMSLFRLALSLGAKINKRCYISGVEVVDAAWRHN